MLVLMLCGAAALASAVPVASAGPARMFTVSCHSLGQGFCGLVCSGCAGTAEPRVLPPTGPEAHVAPPNPLPCTNVDTSNPHFYGIVDGLGVATSQGISGLGLAIVYSTNGVPAGCDQIGSDGDNEQGGSGAQMPITGASCPYSQGATTVGHHTDDIYATNVANIDITWSSGVDGQDPAATLAGKVCTGNGVISDDATTDPADCSDSTGANVNQLGSVHDDTHPLGVGTNDPASGSTCSDAVDGNEWTFLNVGPFVGTSSGSGPLLGADQSGNGCVDIEPTPGPMPPPPPCIAELDGAWLPPTPTGIIGLSLPLQGTINSGVEPPGDSD
jgi:hypothetical protein